MCERGYAKVLAFFSEIRYVGDVHEKPFLREMSFHSEPPVSLFLCLLNFHVSPFGERSRCKSLGRFAF